MSKHFLRQALKGATELQSILISSANKILSHLRHANRIGKFSVLKILSSHNTAISDINCNTDRTCVGLLYFKSEGKETLPSCLERALKMSTRVFEKPEILYQSEHFVAIDKPYDVVINSDDPNRYSVEKLMDKFYPHLRDESVVHGYRFTHRLDNATSGILCFSLSRTSAKLLSKRFQSRNITKHYLALVYGHLSKHRQIIDKKIGKDSSYTDVWCMCTDDKETCTNPKEAVTELICLEEGQYNNKPATKILLIPRTGRTHQLRVHCDNIGHRIVGDFTYSNREDTEPYRMMLHAYRLKFKHRMPDDHYIDIISKDPFLSSLDPKWQTSKLLTTYEKAVSSLDHAN